MSNEIERERNRQSQLNPPRKRIPPPAIFKNSRNDASRNLHGSVIDVDIFVHPRSTKKVYTYWIFFNISLVNFDIIKARNIGDKVLWGEGTVEV